jgi:NAD+ kinase
VDTIKKIGIFIKPKSDISRKVLLELTAWLRERNCYPLMPPETAEIISETSEHLREDIPSKADLIIVLGGDGTLLSVARLTHPFEVPILAVNLGSLGFLTEVTLPDMYHTLEQVLKGASCIEKRMLLNVFLKRKGKDVRNDFALNDVVISKSAARIVNLEVHVNGQYMTSYRADGLIVATPTGSTGYSLSSGGPIIHPSMNALLLSPICPFTLTNRPIVIPNQSILQVQLSTETEEEVQVTLDGQTEYPLSRDDVLEIKQGPTPVSLIQARGKNYYQILRRKLHWGRPADDPKSES